MKNFFLEIFTWWSSQTLGTRIYTLLNGKFVGTDADGNKYYLNGDSKNFLKPSRTFIKKISSEPLKFPTIFFLTEVFLTLTFLLVISAFLFI